MRDPTGPDRHRSPLDPPRLRTGLAWPKSADPFRLCRGWDSSRTKTNGPVAWIAHALMGRKGSFPAQMPTRNRFFARTG